MVNPSTTANPEQIQQYLPLFNNMPDAFWSAITPLWVHYLEAGRSGETAITEAMNDLVLGLPVIQKFIGNFRFTGGVQGQQSRVA